MSKLITNQTIKDLSLIPNLQKLVKFTKNEILIIEASQEKRIDTLSYPEIATLASEIVLIAKSRLGYVSTDEEQAEAEISLIIDDLNGFGLMTGSEVKLALKSGLNGDFSEDGKIFFSSSTFVYWLKKWIDSKKRPVMKEYLSLLEKESTKKDPPTEEEHKQILIEASLRYRDLKIQNPDFVVESCDVLYESIEKFAIWTMPTNEKVKLFNELKEKYPSFSKEELAKIAKNKAYNIFIELLVKNIITL